MSTKEERQDTAKDVSKKKKPKWSKSQKRREEKLAEQRSEKSKAKTQ